MINGEVIITPEELEDLIDHFLVQKYNLEKAPWWDTESDALDYSLTIEIM